MLYAHHHTCETGVLIIPSRGLVSEAGFSKLTYLVSGKPGFKHKFDSRARALKYSSKLIRTQRS